MENSSKALLIAGAILLAILLIGVGMYTYNNASSTVTASVWQLMKQMLLIINL